MDAKQNLRKEVQIDILIQPTMEKVMVPKYRYSCPAGSNLVRRREYWRSYSGGPIDEYTIAFDAERQHDYDTEQSELQCLK